jgi:hypothetical protein
MTENAEESLDPMDDPHNVVHFACGQHVEGAAERQIGHDVEGEIIDFLRDIDWLL